MRPKDRLRNRALITVLTIVAVSAVVAITLSIVNGGHPLVAAGGLVFFAVAIVNVYRTQVRR